MDQTAPIPVRASRNYPLLLASQFLSAFGDNLLLMIMLGPFLTRFKNGTITAQAQSLANVWYPSLLFVPYVLLAPFSGYLNDRFSKSRWLIGGNAIKLLGAAVTALNIVSAEWWMAVGYLIVGVGACVYSPAKYGILPEILPTERLVKANGTVELLTLVAILTGNIGGAIAYDRFPLSECYVMTVLLYGLSLVFNLFMSRTPFYPTVRYQESAQEFFHNLRQLFSQKRLARVLCGTAMFWVCGAVLKMNFQPWGQQVLKLKTMTQISLLGLWLSLGVMAGSVLAGQLYRVGDLHATRRYAWMLASGIASLGSIGWLVDKGLDYPMSLAISLLIVTGFVAGLFLIPLNAALQAESHKDKLGKTIATQNGFENCAMLCGSAIAFLDVKIGFNPSELLLCLAAFVAIAAIGLKVPEPALYDPSPVKSQ